MRLVLRKGVLGAKDAPGGPAAGPGGSYTHKTPKGWRTAGRPYRYKYWNGTSWQSSPPRKKKKKRPSAAGPPAWARGVSDADLAAEVRRRRRIRAAATKKAKPTPESATKAIVDRLVAAGTNDYLRGHTPEQIRAMVSRELSPLSLPQLRAAVAYAGFHPVNTRAKNIELLTIGMFLRPQSLLWRTDLI